MSRNVDSNRRGYNSRAKLYPSVIESEIEVIRKLEYTNAIIFYAKDQQTFSYSRNEFSGVMQRQSVSGYIETMDLKIGDIKINDTVEYDGTKYNVEEVTFNDSNVQKEVTNRPIVKTIIKLGGAIDG